VVSVIILCDQSVARIQPQVRVNRQVLAILITVAVDHDNAFFFNSEIDVGFFSDRHRVRKRRQRSQYSDDKE